MHTPTKAQMQVVIDNLKKVLPLAMSPCTPPRLNMAEPDVKTPMHKCGTVHCFAGWYAFAVNIFEKVYNLPEYYTYIYGILDLERALGFEPLASYDTQNRKGIPHWATSNPGIWGNSCGGQIFRSKTAFYHQTKRNKGAENLQDIVDHLEEVRDRLPA